MNSLFSFFFFFFKDLLYAHQQSIYIPNFHQAFDHSNIDKTPFSIEQQVDINIPTNDASDSSHPVGLSINDFLSQTSTTNVPSEPSLETSTHQLNTISSTENDNNNKLNDQESTSSNEQINKTTDINSTKQSLSKNHTKLIVHWSNKTHIIRKPLRKNKQYNTYNRTLKEAAKYLSDGKFMQSLIHLIPPHLWPQIQQNQSKFHQNQTKPLLPDPVLLAEAAAQAGLPPPGPHPIPEHLWYRFPPEIVTQSSTTCKFNDNNDNFHNKFHSFSFNNAKNISNYKNNNSKT